MSSKQGSSGNRVDIERITRYALFTAVCLIVGYIESLVSLSHIAPGVKLGLSNAVAVILVYSDDIKGAFAVNTARIFLSALLFGSPFSLVFSLSGGIASLLASALLKKVKWFSIIGISGASGAVHNMFQCIAAVAVTGVGVLHYLPILLICGEVSGALVGLLSSVILKKLKTNGNF